MMVLFFVLLSIKYNFSFQSLGMKFQSISVLVACFVYLTLPVVILVGVLQNYRLIDTKQIKERYGSFYEGLATKNGKKVLIQPMYFLAMRLYLSYLVIFSTSIFVY